MEPHHLLFILWFIVFALWLGKQFKAYNRRQEKKWPKWQPPDPNQQW